MKDYLQRYSSHQRRCDSPEPYNERPETEWRSGSRGCAKMSHDLHTNEVGAFGASFLKSLSALACWWPTSTAGGIYRERGLPADRLLVGSIILI